MKKQLLEGAECAFELVKECLNQDRQFELHLNLYNATYRLRSEVERINSASDKIEYLYSLKRTGKHIRKLYSWLETYKLCVDKPDIARIEKIRELIDAPYKQALEELKLSDSDSFYCFGPDDVRLCLQQFRYEKG